MPEKSEKEMTTIAITVEHHEQLKKLKKGFESFDAVLDRLFAHQADVKTEIVLVDNDLPQLHTLVLQLGEDKNSLYYWDGEKFDITTLKETNKMMKQPKPNFTLSQAEAKQLYHELPLDIGLSLNKTLVDTVVKRLEKYVESLE